jgi:molybdopterin/thiamine biosynthesis adenylyltransferase
MLSSLVASFIGAFKKLHPGIEVTPIQQTITSDNEIEVGQSVK